QNLKIHIALGSTDMRKSIDGLSILVSETLNFRSILRTHVCIL
ncbi:IS66 Orf2 like protein, partial [Desulfobacter postgatei 2ac9]